MREGTQIEGVEFQKIIDSLEESYDKLFKNIEEKMAMLEGANKIALENQIQKTGLLTLPTLPINREVILEFNDRLENIQREFWRKYKPENGTQKLQILEAIIKMLETLNDDMGKLLIKQQKQIN